MKNILGLLLLLNCSLYAETMFITVKESPVRSAPSFLGKVLTVLHYTDEVEVTGESRGWYIISNELIDEGWLPVSAVTSDPLVLKKSDRSISNEVSGDEVSLAGKGFNSEMEAAFKGSTGLDYTWIDQMESDQYDLDVVMEFIGYK